MIQKVFLSAVLALALVTAGCGSKGAAEKATQAAKDAGSAVTETAKDVTAEAQEQVKDAAAQAKDAAESAAEAAGEAVKDAAETAKTKTSEAAKTVSEKAKDAVSEKAKDAASDHSKPGVDTSNLAPAPPWALYDLTGKELRSDAFAGKVMIVDFWATWCGPCRRSIPAFIELYEEYKDKGLAVVGISLDQKGPSVVRPFVKSHNIEYPIVMGNQRVVNDFGGIRGIPTAFIISQDGKIYRKYVGLRPKALFEKDIRDLLGLTS